MMDKIVSAVRLAAQFPSVTSVKLLPGDSVSTRVVLSNWTQPDVDRGQQATFSRTHLLNEDLHILHRGQPTVTSNTIKYECWSPSRKLKALVTSSNSESKDEKFFLEIWNKTRQLHLWDLSAKDVHGAIYTDGTLGSLSWSQDETKLAYVAEKKCPKTESPFSQKPAKEDDKTNVTDEYLYREDWGEQRTGKHHPVLCVLTVQTGSIQILEQIPEGFSPGQVQFVGNASVVGVVWNEMPYRLGIVFCSNRSSKIFCASLDGKYCEVSLPGRAVYSPRVSSDSSCMVYLDRPEGGPHQRCYRLMLYNFSTKKNRILVDTVDAWYGSGFAGIYGYDQLPVNCWINNSVMTFNTVRKNTYVSYIVYIKDNDVTLLQLPSDRSNCIFDACNGVIVGKQSSLNSPDSLVLGRLPETLTEDSIKEFQWILLDEKMGDKCLENVKVTSITLTSITGLDYNCLIAVPECEEKEVIPWILCPHGGPHGAFTNDYSWGTAFYLNMGFGLVLVNFTGSVGLGDASIEMLLGKIGSADVKDVHSAGIAACKAEPKLDPNTKFLSGGSHGGFLVLHLIAQYPNEYKACVTRNPVSDLSSNICVTDIPDWNFVETGQTFEFSRLPNPEVLKQMWDVSPIQLIDNVTTPTLLLVGEEDKRVPPSQSFYYYKMLRARGVTSRLLKYPDCHSLAKVKVACDSMVNIMKWFLNYS